MDSQTNEGRLVLIKIGVSHRLREIERHCKTRTTRGIFDSALWGDLSSKYYSPCLLQILAVYHTSTFVRALERRRETTRCSCAVYALCSIYLNMRMTRVVCTVLR